MSSFREFHLRSTNNLSSIATDLNGGIRIFDNRNLSNTPGYLNPENLRTWAYKEEI
jgi:hypothetical protein